MAAEITSTISLSFLYSSSESQPSSLLPPSRPSAYGVLTVASFPSPSPTHTGHSLTPLYHFYAIQWMSLTQESMLLHYFVSKYINYQFLNVIDFFCMDNLSFLSFSLIWSKEMRMGRNSIGQEGFWEGVGAVCRRKLGLLCSQPPLNSFVSVGPDWAANGELGAANGESKTDHFPSRKELLLSYSSHPHWSL